MKYVFSSVFAPEINRYLKLIQEAGRFVPPVEGTLRNLDRYLTSNGLLCKSLDADTLSAWIKTRNVSPQTKAQDIVNINGFVKYLVSLGFTASSPEPPKVHADYVAYIFTDNEFERIFAAADNYQAGKSYSRAPLLFPVLLRLLYGCGLRLGEGLSLRWENVDLESGVLTIKKAKNKKQRFVPMSETATNMLKDYRETTQYDGICGDYLFESNLKPGYPLKKNTFTEWFARIRRSAGIHYAKTHPQERGPCPHCLRHCFTLKSFLKSEGEGRRFEDTAPFLAAYLGHDGPGETEKYLNTNYAVYMQSHQRVSAAIGHLFPEVSFGED